MTVAGRLVVLNGVSSAGKTTLASAFRDDRAEVGELWVVFGIDDVLSKLPTQWLDLADSTGPGSRAHEGLWFEGTASGQRLRVGPECRKVLDVYHRSVADAVRAGLNVIVDDVVIDRATLDSWVRELDGLHPTWVCVHCPREVAISREVERGDRPIGMVEAQYDTVHSDVPYAFDIDSHALTPAEALTALKRHLGLDQDLAGVSPPDSGCS
jgi:chloramphenicol 3-O phosphotransferase